MLFILPLLTLILLTVNLLLFTVREARRVVARRQLSSDKPIEEREFSSEKSNNGAFEKSDNGASEKSNNDGTDGKAELEKHSSKSEKKAELENQARRLKSIKIKT